MPASSAYRAELEQRLRGKMENIRSRFRPPTTPEDKIFGLQGDSEAQVFHQVLTEEDFQEAKEDTLPTMPGIMEVLDFFNRPFYGVMGGAKEAVEQARDPVATAGEKISEIADAVWEGLKGKRTDLRDVLREVDPEAIANVEVKTGTTIVGLEMDVLSPFLFTGEVIADPLTYFGLLKIAGKIGNVGLKVTRPMGKTGMTIARKYLGPAKSAAIAKKAGRIKELYNKAFNRRELMKYTDETGKVHDFRQMFDDLKEAGERSGVLAKEAGRSVMNASDKYKLFREASEKVGEGIHKISDDGLDVYHGLYSKEVGLAVEDLLAFHDFDDVIQQLAQLKKGSPEFKELYKEITKSMGQSLGFTKKRIGYGLKRAILEGRGFKKLANKLAKAEMDAAKTVGKVRFSMARELHRQTKKYLNQELNGIEKILASDIRATSKMFQSDVNESARALKYLSTYVDDMAKTGSDELGSLVKNQTRVINTRLKVLDRYQSEITKYGIRKSTGSYRKIKSMMRDVQARISQFERRATSEEGRLLGGQIKKLTRDMRGELRAYSTLAQAELKGIKAGSKAMKDLNLSSLKHFQEKRIVLQKDLGYLDTFYNAERKAYAALTKGAERMAPQNAKKYFKAANIIGKGTARTKALAAFKKVENDIFETGLKKHLPEELHPHARKVREIMKAKETELKQVGLLEEGVPIYMPRVLTGDFRERFGSAMARTGTSTGFLKHRKFRKARELKEWAEANGGKIENDSTALIMNYVSNHEVAVARKNVMDSILAKLGKKELPKDLAENIDYVFNNRLLKSEYPLDVAFSAYGKTLNTTKASLTVINPAFHGRNILGFPMLAATTAGFLNAFRIGNYADAIQIIAGREGKFFSKKLGREFTFKEIREAAFDSGYFGSSFLRGDIFLSADAMLKRYNKKTPLGLLKWSMASVFDVSMRIEDMGRMGALMANLRKGMDLPDAVKAARKAMFDYNLINSPVDKAMQGIFGFYCVPTDCEILTQKGWKTYDQLENGEKIVSYNVEKDVLESDVVKEVAVFPYEGKLQSFEHPHRKIEFLFTDNHRWPRLRENGKRDIVQAKDLVSGDRIPFSADYVPPETSPLTVDQCKLLGWIITDGTRKLVGNSIVCALYQTEHKYAQEIRGLVPDASEFIHPVSKTVRFRVKVRHTEPIREYLFDNDALISLLFKLNKSCLDAMYDVVYKADGNSRGQEHIANQRDGRTPEMSDFIQILCCLTGRAAHVNPRGLYIKNKRYFKVSKAVRHERHYHGNVWCPQTNNGTWVMRRNGKIIITGNTFSRRNLPRQVANMFNNPQQYAIVSRVLNKISNREELSKEELLAMNEYDRTTLKLFGHVIDGVREFTALGFTPVEEAYQTMTSLVKTYKSGHPVHVLGGRLNPVLGSMLDWYYGKNSFYQNDLGNVLPAKYTTLIDSLPEAVVKSLDLTKRTKPKYRGGRKVGEESVYYGDTDTIFAIRNIPLWSRTISDFASLTEGISGGAKTPKGKKAILRYLSGIRASKIDAEKGIRGMKYRYKKALRKKGKARGARTFERMYMPKEKDRLQLLLEELKRRAKR